MPSLRERREDIPLLVEYFLDRHNRRYRQKKQFNREALRQILDHPWPGNVRELENAVERAFVLSGGNVIRETDLPPEMTLPAPLTTTAQAPHSDLSSAPTSSITAGTIPPEGFDLDAHLLAVEKAFVAEAIRLKDGNREAAARLLKMKPHTFRKRAKEKFGL